MNTKECPATQNFDTPIFEVECIVMGDGFRLGDCLIVETVGDREVGQGGDAG